MTQTWSPWSAWLRNWSPAVLWTILIFLGSGSILSAAQTSRVVLPLLHHFLVNLSLHQLDLVHFALRKTGHLTEYFILTVLVWRGLSGFNPNGQIRWRRTHALMAWIFPVCYAISDEYHQSFVASRHASMRDVLLDATGAALGLAGAYALVQWRRNRLKNAAQRSHVTNIPCRLNC